MREMSSVDDGTRAQGRKEVTVEWQKKDVGQLFGNYECGNSNDGEEKKKKWFISNDDHRLGAQVKENVCFATATTK